MGMEFRLFCRRKCCPVTKLKVSNMLKISNLKVSLTGDILSALADKLGVAEKDIKNLKILRKSVDARKRDNVYYVYTVAADVCKKYKSSADITEYTPPVPIYIPDRKLNHRPVVVGCGPAGMFAALMLAKAGQRPVLIEQGKPVKERSTDIDQFYKTGILDPTSNVQFGEGGAGTFSDGKLNTGIKSPYIREVLKTFYECGAPEEILYMARPHIGSDRLAVVIPNLRKLIISLGGEVLFNTSLTDLIIKNNKIYGVVTPLAEIETEHVFLATGHSSRDIFELLYKKGVNLAPKPFSVGVRIEHLQEDINLAQYGKFASLLPAADYKHAVHLKSGYGVYTFCMCPGGFVSASASEKGGVVTNGYSNLARDGQNANSALLVGVNPTGDSPLCGIDFQKQIEQSAFNLSGGDYKAPCQKVGDFLQNKPSVDFGKVLPTYPRGVVLGDVAQCLPAFVVQALREGILMIDRQMPGFADKDALLTAPETRSSSPVRIVRDQNMQSSVHGLYPIGEGSGYAGGIVSSAVDGIKSVICALSAENKL